MIPEALMGEIMSLFQTNGPEDYERLRNALIDVIYPWWAAMTAMILLAAEEGLPSAETYEV